MRHILHCLEGSVFGSSCAVLVLFGKIRTFQRGPGDMPVCLDPQWAIDPYTCFCGCRNPTGNETSR